MLVSDNNLDIQSNLEKNPISNSGKIIAKKVRVRMPVVKQHSNLNGNRFEDRRTRTQNKFSNTKIKRTKKINNEKTTKPSHKANSNKPNKKKRVSARSVLTNVVLAIILISSPLFFVLNFDYPGADLTAIQIDGDFQDWSDKIEYEDSINDQSNPNIDITQCKVERLDETTSFYVEVDGEILHGHEDDSGEVSPDIVRIMIDGDKDINTGYSLNNIGADYMIEIQGQDGEAIVKPFYIFDADYRTDVPRQQNDWSGWRQHYNVDVTTDGNKLETQVSIPYYLDKPKDQYDDDQILAVVQVIDGKGNNDVTENPISNNPSLLLVNQKSIAPEVLTNDISEMLELSFSARGTDVVVKSISFSNTGGGSLIELPYPILVKKDKTVEHKLKLNTKSVSSGKVVSVAINSPKDIITTDNVPVKLTGTGAKAYVKTLPSTINIDGLFADWKNVKKVEDVDSYSLNNSNIDIQNYAVHNSGTELSFYIDVAGVILQGSKTPNQPIIGKVNESAELLSASSSASTNLPDLPLRTGEDSLFIFIDSDNNKNTGYGPWLFPVGADQMIEINGQNGKVKNSKYYEFIGGENQVDWNWSQSKGELPVGLSNSQLETQISCKKLGTNTMPGVYYYIMDWTDIGDFSDESVVPRRVRELSENLREHNGVRGISSYMVINELKYTYNNIGEQYIELFNPTNNDLGEDYTIYRVRGPQVTKILTLIENVSSQMCTAWNPDTAGFYPGDMLILKDTSNNTMDVVILPHTLDSGDSYQRYVDKNDGKPIDTGGVDEFFTGDFYVTNAMQGDTLDFPNLKSKSIPEYYDFIVPIILLFVFAVLVRKCYKKSKHELL